jgi:hypothetical protein
MGDWMRMLLHAQISTRSKPGLPDADIPHNLRTISERSASSASQTHLFESGEVAIICDRIVINRMGDQGEVEGIENPGVLCAS